MPNILFVCHGNICRSTMAESVFSDMLNKRNVKNINVSSAATHNEEIGNPPHYGTREKLRREGIPVIPHKSRLLTQADGDQYDFIIGMDEENLHHMHRILGEDHKHKISLLLDYTPDPRAIADPWYTGNFDQTYQDIAEGCTGLLNYLYREGYLHSEKKE